MNFGSKDDFSELILKRKDGAVYTIALTGLEGHSISIGREGNRTVLRIELRADMSHVRYQGVFGLSRVEQLRGDNLLLPPGDRREDILEDTEIRLAVEKQSTQKRSSFCTAVHRKDLKRTAFPRLNQNRYLIGCRNSLQWRIDSGAEIALSWMQD